MKTLKEIIHNAVSRWAEKRQTEQNVPNELFVVCEELETSFISDVQSPEKTEKGTTSVIYSTENDNLLSASALTESEKNELAEQSLSFIAETDHTILQSDKQESLPVSDITVPTETSETTKEISQNKSTPKEKSIDKEEAECQKSPEKKRKPGKFTKRQQQRKKR